MDDVEVGDTVEEEVTHPAEEVTVEGRSGTTRVGPLLAAVVGQLGVGVVEVGDHNEPMVHAEPWDTVVLDDVCESVLQAGDLDGVHHGEDAEVGDDDNVALGLGKDDSGGYTVVI